MPWFHRHVACAPFACGPGRPAQPALSIIRPFMQEVRTSQLENEGASPAYPADRNGRLTQFERRDVRRGVVRLNAGKCPRLCRPCCWLQTDRQPDEVGHTAQDGRAAGRKQPRPPRNFHRAQGVPHVALVCSLEKLTSLRRRLAFRGFFFFFFFWCHLEPNTERHRPAPRTGCTSLSASRQRHQMPWTRQMMTLFLVRESADAAAADGGARAETVPG